MTLEDEVESFRILLIEDDPEDARQIQEMLRDAPCRFLVTVATTLSESLTRAVESCQDLVLLDLDLSVSGIRGLETFLRLVDAVEDVPIVVLSRRDDAGTAQEAVRRGAQDYLVKGVISEHALQRVLRYSIERHRFEAQRRSLEIQLAQSRKLEAIGQLAAGIAHEINTPTQYVSDNTRFLRDSLTDAVSALRKLQARCSTGEPVPHQDLQRVLEEADVEYLESEIPRALDQSLKGLSHISRIVRAMKEFSHPASEEKTPTNLSDALETTIVVASNEWKYVAKVETDFDAELPPVACLPGEMNQVFLNLIVNAAHAIADVVDPTSKARGLIRVATRALDDGTAEITIADSGSGISEENQPKVFDPFFTTKGVGKGTGQGLAIAYNVVVNKHGGTISFSSAPGEGTCFTIRLPVSGEPKANDHPPPRDAAA